MLGAKHCIAVNSGSAALLVAMAGLGVGPGDEIVAPDMTFVLYRVVRHLSCGGDTSLLSGHRASLLWDGRLRSRARHHPAHEGHRPRSLRRASVRA